MLPLAQISVQPSVAITLIGMLATALGAFFAVKFGLKETQREQAETQRLVKALHNRFDEMEKEHQQLRIDHEVLAERVNSRLRQPTRRFTMTGVASENDEGTEG